MATKTYDVYGFFRKKGSGDAFIAAPGLTVTAKATSPAGTVTSPTVSQPDATNHPGWYKATITDIVGSEGNHLVTFYTADDTVADQYVPALLNTVLFRVDDTTTTINETTQNIYEGTNVPGDGTMLKQYIVKNDAEPHDALNMVVVSGEQKKAAWEDWRFAGVQVQTSANGTHWLTDTGDLWRFTTTDPMGRYSFVNPDEETA